MLHIVRALKSLYAGLADAFDPLGSATTAYHLLVTSVRERANLGIASAIPAAEATARLTSGTFDAHASKGKGPAEKAPRRSYEAIVTDLFTVGDLTSGCSCLHYPRLTGGSPNCRMQDKEDAQGIVDLIAGLLTALHRPAQSASTAHWPVTERTAVYACELIATAVRSPHQEFMLRTRQLTMTSAMGAGGPPTIHRLLAGSLDDRSPQVRVAMGCLW